MLEHLNVEKLPHVDAIPEDGQTRIRWIKNGERLTAAENCTSNDGVLNRAPVAIQQNVVHVHTQHTKATEKINELVDQINNINTALGSVGDHSVIQLLNETVTRVDLTEGEVRELNQAVIQASADIAATNATIGERLPTDAPDRTLREELAFQKSEIGAYTGFDVNGRPDPESHGSGMKYRIQSNTAALNNHGQRIADLEKSWQDSDVGELTNTVNKLRSEIGDSSLATQDNIYLRLRTNTRSIASTLNEVAEVKKAILFDAPQTIGEKVTDLGDKYTALNRDVNGAENGFKPRLLSLEAKVGNPNLSGSLDQRLTTTERTLETLYHTVGTSNSDGLRGKIADLSNQIGQDSDRHTIAGRIKVVETAQSQLQGTVQDMSQILGNQNNGIVAGMLKMSTEMYGNPQGSNDFEQKGVIRVLKEVQTTANNSVLDVPDDGLHYVRKHNAWVQVAHAAAAFKSTQLISVQLGEQDTYKAIPLTTTNEEFPSRAVNKADQSVTIQDTGIFRVDFRASIRHLHNATFVVAVYKNGVLADEAGNGYYAMDEHVNYGTSSFLNITKGDEISIQIKGVSPESVAQAVEIDGLLLAITPV